MLALVKTPHINEISIYGADAEEILAYLKEKYPVSVCSAPQDDDDELVNANQSDYAQSNRWRVLAGYRLKAGLTQRELAEKTGIRQSVISEYECGKRVLTQAAAIKLADALTLSPAKLLL